MQLPPSKILGRSLCREPPCKHLTVELQAGAQITYYEGAGSIRISFASMYLNEEDRSAVLTKRIVANKRMIGTRIGAWTMLHPNCDRGKNFAADFGIIGEKLR